MAAIDHGFETASVQPRMIKFNRVRTSSYPPNLFFGLSLYLLQRPGGEMLTINVKVHYM